MATDQERDAPPAVPAAGSPGKGEETETAHAGGEPVVQEQPRSFRDSRGLFRETQVRKDD